MHRKNDIAIRYLLIFYKKKTLIHLVYGDL